MKIRPILGLLFLPLLPTLFSCSSARGGSDSSPIQVLHSFSGQDGATAKGSLTLSADGGTLFGRTSVGGAANNGVIFQVGTDGSQFAVLNSFTAGSDNGTGNQPHHDSMLLNNGTLYGAALQGGNTDNGGSNGNGVLFGIGTGGGDYAVLRSFEGGSADGSQSHSCFSISGNTLYGMTALGGAHNEGTIYQMNSDGSGYQILHSFSKSKGSQPHGRPGLSDGGNALFGMTRKGGSSDLGVIFRFDLSSGDYQVLHDFVGGNQDGATSDHGYLVESSGVLYGMTTEGGPQDQGVLFQINSDGSKFQLLHTFPDGSGDGENPYGSLALFGGKLFGMTREGGTYDQGTVFQINTDGSGYQILASFQGKTTGAYPIDNVTIKLIGSKMACVITTGDYPIENLTINVSGKMIFVMTLSGVANDPGLVYQYGTVFALPLAL